MSAPAACRLCGGPVYPLFEKTLLRSRRVGYWQCGACGLTQTDEPDWLGEAYAEPIHPADTGLLARNLRLRAVTASFLQLSGTGDEPGLDWAGGFGVFTRLMRDAGFRFHWLDPYAPNLFARGFEWDGRAGVPALVTAFEVLEHFVRPLEEFRKIAAFGARWIVTSTEIHPGSRPDPDWPYLAAETGQHIAFYRVDTLQRLGAEAGYPHVLAGPFVQLFAREPLPGWRWRLADRFGPLLHPVLRRLRRSLTVADSERLRRSPPGPAGAPRP